MLQFLNRFSGIIVGGVLYPLKSSVVNVGVAGLALIAAPFVWILFPLGAFFNALDTHDDDIFETLFKAIVLPVLAIVLLPVVAIAAFLAHIALTIFDVLRTFVLGLTEGAEYGLLIHVLDKVWSDFMTFTSTIQIVNYFSGHAPEVEPVADTSPSHPLNSQTETYSESPDFLPLAKAELLKAGQIAELGVVLGHYQQLFEKLNILDQAIRSKGNNDYLPDVIIGDKTVFIEDELIGSTPINQPSLLVKQYEAEPGRWLAVPVSSFYIDRANFEMLQQHRRKNGIEFTHPLTGEAMESPPPYKDKSTRHRIHEYHTLANAQELIEAAGIIRERLNALSKDMEPSKESQPSEDICSKFLNLFSIFSSSEKPSVVAAPQRNDGPTFR